MLAHRESRAIALGTEGKLRILADLLTEHYPEQTLVFTNDNATVYRISQDFLIPAITHQTPVKERHDILQQFRAGTYRVLVASHVLNEGVDVPAASIAVLLSGTGSAREYIQRLGRILRKGSGQKQAKLYEVVAEETAEENVSRRRRKSPKRPDFVAAQRPSPGQLELVSPATPSPQKPYPKEPYPKEKERSLPRAAEQPGAWNAADSGSTNSEEEHSETEKTDEPT